MIKYYKTGEFAKMANLSIRTIRYYDKIGLLKPTKIAENGYRLYTDKDFIKLQKILSLKYLGFSLDEIFSMTVNDSYISLQQSLSLQKKMIEQKIENLLVIKDSLDKTEQYISKTQDIDWEKIMTTIHFQTLEKDLLKQYKNSTNINIRIQLHEKYSMNPLSWFEWLFQQYHLKDGMKVLEIGCGNGQLWKINQKHIPHIDLILSDISLGMLEDAELCVDMIQTQEYGTYHATNEGICSWYEFACEIFKQANMDVKVNPVDSSAFPVKATRPKNSRMSKEELDKHGFNRLPTWQDALKRYLNIYSYDFK